jgi:hypothetical protein
MLRGRLTRLMGVSTSSLFFPSMLFQLHIHAAPPPSIPRPTHTHIHAHTQTYAYTARADAPAFLSPRKAYTRIHSRTSLPMRGHARPCSMVLWSVRSVVALVCSVSSCSCARTGAAPGLHRRGPRHCDLPTTRVMVIVSCGTRACVSCGSVHCSGSMFMLCVS